MKRLLVLLPLAAAVACGSSSAQPALPSLPPTTQPPAPQEGPVGTTFSDGPLTVTVDSVKLVPQLTAPGGIPDPEPAHNGQWAVIHVSEQNHGPAPVDTGNWSVQGDDGTEWDQVTQGDLYGQELPDDVSSGDRAAGLVMVDMGRVPGRVLFGDRTTGVSFRWPIG